MATPVCGCAVWRTPAAAWWPSATQSSTRQWCAMMMVMMMTMMTMTMTMTMTVMMMIMIVMMMMMMIMIMMMMTMSIAMTMTMTTMMLFRAPSGRCHAARCRYDGGFALQTGSASSHMPQERCCLGIGVIVRVVA